MPDQQTSEQSRELKCYDVLRLDPIGPVYFLARAWDADAEPEVLEYHYDERACPHDLFTTVEHVIEAGDTDPHGILEYVKTIEVAWEYPCDPAEVLRPHVPEAFEASPTPDLSNVEELVERLRELARTAPDPRPMSAAMYEAAYTITVLLDRRA